MQRRSANESRRADRRRGNEQVAAAGSCSHRHTLRFSPWLPPRSSLAVSSLSFWIVTATPTVRDLKLRVDGETRTRAAGRGLTLEMPREFTWQVDERTPENERVPTNEAGVEIVIRR